MKANIALLPGDGIGPEVTAAAVEVLRAIAVMNGHEFAFAEHLIGGAAIDATGEPLPLSTKEGCLGADAILLGAVGGPKWSDPAAKARPEQGLLQLRATLGVYANLRPVRVHPRAAALSPIKAERLDGTDLVFVRELTGGSYFGARTRDADSASDECRYTVAEIERVVRRAFELARTRRRHLTSIDKANVLETSRLWRETTQRIAADYPDVTLEHQLVDSMAMLLLTRPSGYDVLVTENLFGDILSDEAAVLAGSLGLLPSASLGDGRRGLYEPIHGSAPDIAGRGIANPYATILSAALLLRHSLGLESEARCIEKAVGAALDAGVFTADIAAAGRGVGTQAATAAVDPLGARESVDVFVDQPRHVKGSPRGGAERCRGPPDGRGVHDARGLRVHRTGHSYPAAEQMAAWNATQANRHPVGRQLLGDDVDGVGEVVGEQGVRARHVVDRPRVLATLHGRDALALGSVGLVAALFQALVIQVGDGDVGLLLRCHEMKRGDLGRPLSVLIREVRSLRCACRRPGPLPWSPRSAMGARGRCGRCLRHWP